MTQSIVNFLVENGSGQNVTFTTDPRIFDFEIDPNAVTLYTDLMTTIQNNLNDLQTQDPSSAQYITDLQNISAAFKELNDWSKLRTVQTVNGVTAQTYQIYTGPNTFITVPLNNDGSLDLTNVPTQTKPDPNNPAQTIQAPLGPTFIGNDPVTGNPITVTSTMDQYMAQDLDKLVRTFRAAGWDPIATPAPVDINDLNYTGVVGAVQSITGPNASIYNIIGPSGILAQALNAASQARVLGYAAATQSDSIQQVLMVDYISRGNELLYNEMNNLQQAINLNQTTLQYLNSLQDLMNQKDPQQFVMQLQDLNNVQIVSNDSGQSQYNTFEAQSYNEALTTIAKFQSDGTLAAYFDPNSSGAQDPTNTSFQVLNGALTAAVQYSKDQIINNLTYLVNQISSISNPSVASPLTIALNRIINDFKALPTDNDPIKTWVQDAQQGSQGDYQRHLDDAITGSQSFDDSEREELRRVMFVFEEFYKSADGLLSRLTQLIEKMASAIAR